MKNNLQKDYFKDRLYIIEILFLGSIIFFMNIWNLGNYSGMINGVDEYGYLSNAIFMIGEKVDQVAHTLSYYSFGYSFFLIPLVATMSDSVLLFRSIVLLNSLFIVLSYVLITLVGINLHKEVKRELVIFLTFVSFFYVSNYTYSKYIYTECLLTFLISLLIFLFVWFIQDFKTYKMVLLVIVSTYMYFVHQRSVVVLIALAITYSLFLLRKDISWKQFMCVILCLSAVFIVGLEIKEILMDGVYTDSIKASLNDYSGQVSKFNYLLNFAGVKDFILQFFAKIYYFSFSTIFCGPIALLYCVRKMIIHRLEKESYFYFFIFILFMGIFCIQAIFLQGPVARFDVVVYGRYAEYIYPILFFEGIICIISTNKTNEVLKMCLISYGMTVLGINTANIIFEENNLVYYESFLCPALFSTYGLEADLRKGIILSMFFSTSFLLIFMVGKNNIKVLVGSISTIFIIFHLWGAYQINQSLSESQKSYIEETKELLAKIDDVDTDILFLLDNSNNYQKYRRLQYRLKKSEFEGIYKEDLINSGVEGYILIDYTEREILEYITYKTLIYDNNGFSLWYIGESL